MLKGFKHSKETKRKISIALKGKIRSLKHSLNISKAKKGFHSSPKTEFKKGMMSGINNYNWKDGKSFEPYTLDWTETLRRSIRERDRYTCQLCRELQGDRAHSVHHIDYDKKNCNPYNLITLCVKCNSTVNFNRDYWTDYFNNIMKCQN